MPNSAPTKVLGWNFCRQKDVIFARIDRKEVSCHHSSRAACQLNDKQLISEFSDFISATIQADVSKNPDEAVLEFYRKLRPGEPVVMENAQKFFEERFFDLRTYELGPVGRYKVNKKFGFKFDDTDKANWVLRKEDLIATVKYLVQLQKGEVTRLDDIDSLANRRLRRCGEIVSQIAIRPAMARFERMVKERMSLISTKEKTGSQSNDQSSTAYLYSQHFL